MGGGGGVDNYEPRPPGVVKVCLSSEKTLPVLRRDTFPGGVHTSGDSETFREEITGGTVLDLDPSGLAISYSDT